MTTDQKREDYIRAGLALSLIPEIGAFRIKKLFEHFESPMSVFSSSWSELARVERIGAAIARSIHSFKDWNKVDQLVRISEKHKMLLLTPFDDHYPDRLKQIPDPPAVLWVRGFPEALKSKFIAVIGTRKPSAEGREATIKLTQELLSMTELAVVSGLAHGVDTIAHHVTLEENRCTVAVLGCGVDRIYPAGNIRLAHQIMNKGGAIISEYPPGTRPEPHHFPIRNRIVSGMSLGVLITETGMKGGSRSTASNALEQNREVFVVPHAISNLRGAGSNYLIMRSHGKLVSSAIDMLDEFPRSEIPYRYAINHVFSDSGGSTNFGGSKSPGGSGIKPGHSGPYNGSRNDPTAGINKREREIYDKLTTKPVHIDELSQKLRLHAGILLPVLLKLELSGIIRQLPGKKFKRNS